MAGFSEDVRRELLKTLPEKPCCLQSELNALTQGYAVIVLRGSGRFQVRYRLPDGDTARMVFVLLKRRLGMTPSIVNIPGVKGLDAVKPQNPDENAEPVQEPLPERINPLDD